MNIVKVYDKKERHTAWTLQYPGGGYKTISLPRYWGIPLWSSPGAIDEDGYRGWYRLADEDEIDEIITEGG